MRKAYYSTRYGRYGDSTERNPKIVIAVVVAAVVIAAGVAAAVFWKPSKESTSVEYVAPLNPSLMDAWLQANESEAYIAWEPFVSSAVVAGTGKVLEWTSEIMPHHPCCVVVASNAFISGTDGPVLTLRFVKAHAEATAWANNALANPDGPDFRILVNISADFTKRSPAVVEEAFKHLEYGFEMNASFKEALTDFTDMYLETGYITNQTFHDAGYSTPEQFVDEYVNESYLDGIGGVTPSGSILNPTKAIRLGYLTGDLHQVAQAVARNKTAFGGQSMFEKYGLNVTPAAVQGYGNGGLEMTAFLEGAVDIGYLGAPPAILNKINKAADTVIVAQANSEGSGIVVGVNSHIESLEDLRGHIVATPGETSIQHLLLRVALERLDIPLVKA